jgi:hypothetical protein
VGSKKEYIGTLEVKLANGKTLEVVIHKAGRTIWINKEIVHPSNRDSFDGIINEIGIIHNSAVKEYDWKTYAKHLEFRRYSK